MAEDRYNLSRFIDAQNNVYSIVLRELQEGRKRSHWMWYIFPQLKHLGHSYNAKFYGLSGIDEASEYLNNPILGQRLREDSMAILKLPTNNAREVFGDIDSLKLRSSMTLFNIVSPKDVFVHILDKYFRGQRDILTLKLLNQTNET